jgi:hypothetical protein
LVTVSENPCVRRIVLVLAAALVAIGGLAFAVSRSTGSGAPPQKGALSYLSPTSSQLGGGWTVKYTAIPITYAAGRSCSNYWLRYAGRTQGSVVGDYGATGSKRSATLGERFGIATTTTTRALLAKLAQPTPGCGAATEAGRGFFRTNSYFNFGWCSTTGGHLQPSSPPALTGVVTLASQSATFPWGSDYCYAVLGRHAFGIIDVFGPLSGGKLHYVAQRAASVLGQ